MPDHRHAVRSAVVEFRERTGTAVLRTAAELAADRRATIRRVAALPAGTPGRSPALGTLAVAAWVEQALLWVGWRLLPRRTLPDRASSPAR